MKHKNLKPTQAADTVNSGPGFITTWSAVVFGFVLIPYVLPAIVIGFIVDAFKTAFHSGGSQVEKV